MWGWSESAELRLRVGVHEGVMKGAAGQAAGWIDRGQGRASLAVVRNVWEQEGGGEDPGGEGG